MDIYGNALTDHFLKGSSQTLWLHNSYDDPEEMPIEVFFRKADEMPELELLALKNCYGKVIDVGAGVGAHTLILQQNKIDVTAIDISPKAVEIMKKRGVKTALVQDVFKITTQYDTLLMLMNGIGLTGTLLGFIDFLTYAKTLIKSGGQIIFDSSDISYLYEDLPKPNNRYFGEVSYRYEYKKEKGNWFNWLYIDQQTLIATATAQGWQTEILFEDDQDQYLAKLTKSTRT